MKKQALLLTFVTMMVVVGFSSLSAQWTVYDCSILPETATPQWVESDKTAGLTENGVSDLFQVVDDPEIAGNKLIKVEELIGDRKESFVTPLGITDANVGVTLIFRAKATDGILAIQADNGQDYRYIYVSLRSNAFREQLQVDYPDKLNMEYIPLTLDFPNAAKWHVYRFTLKNDQVNVYIDEEPTAFVTGTSTKTTSDNFIKIGDASTGGFYGCYFDWIIWDLSGAYAPGTGTLIPAGLQGPISTDVSIQNELLPVTHRLYQNYPNPFNPSTGISFDIGSRDVVSLKIYDINGKLVRDLMDETKETGAYHVQWNGRDHSDRIVSAGIYLSSLRVGNSLFVNKMTLLK